MMPIATISLVTADQLSCWLTAASTRASKSSGPPGGTETTNFIVLV
jgi:hypothetical protein